MSSKSDEKQETIFKATETMEETKARMKIPYRVLPTIGFCQFAGTSLWFAPNAVVSEIPNFGTSEIAILTSMVQVGFILGTLVISLLAIADRFPAVYVFCLLGVIGSALNLICVATQNFAVWVFVRLVVGFCLAGIYPVGLKVASQWYKEGLGFRLGVLVGALTLGTAFPWLLRGLGESSGATLEADTTLIVVSVIAFVGAILMPLLAKPPNMENKTIVKPQIGVSAIRAICRERKFRAAAFGYFGHMWELYGLWVFFPVLIEYHQDVWEGREAPVLNVELTTFCAIAIGTVSSVALGFLSLWVGTEDIPGPATAAFIALFTSLICILLAPLSEFMPPVLFFIYLLIWGSAVIADSGQFSTLCAISAPESLVGTALTLSTCIGFAITVITIQLLTYLGELDTVSPGVALLLLAPGPIFGCVATLQEWPVYTLCKCKCKGRSCCCQTVPENEVKDKKIFDATIEKTVDDNNSTTNSTSSLRSADLTHNSAQDVSMA